MKAISLWQPWATGIALRVKRIETRHWATPHRGEIAIHAAKRWELDQRMFAEDERRAGTISFGLPFGAIIAVVDLLDIKRSEQLLPTIGDVEERWGNYGPKRFGWILGNVRVLPEPVPCRGMQSIWSLDDGTAARVNEQLSRIPEEGCGTAREAPTASVSADAPNAPSAAPHMGTHESKTLVGARAEGAVSTPSPQLARAVDPSGI